MLAVRAEVCRLNDELEAKSRELARQNRLADLGQMASHIAHEVRNSLVPMKLYLSLLRRRIDEFGGKGTWGGYAWGWAWASNTPFRLWKSYTWLGGVRVPVEPRLAHQDADLAMHAVSYRPAAPPFASPVARKYTDGARKRCRPNRNEVLQNPASPGYLPR